MRFSAEHKIATVHAWFAAYNSRDVAELARLAHPSIEILPMRPLMGPLVGTAFLGHTGLRTLMQWTFEHFPHIHVERVNPRLTNSSITAETRFVYDAKSEPPMARDIWSLFDIGHDGIRRISAYASADELRAAARQSGVLTPREREIFTMLAGGLTANEIADELVLSPLTVRTHIQNGKDRLGARTRMEALTIALTRGEVSV